MYVLMEQPLHVIQIMEEIPKGCYNQFDYFVFIFTIANTKSWFIEKKKTNLRFNVLGTHSNDLAVRRYCTL